MNSTFYNDGYRDGYAAVMADDERKPSPPDQAVYASEYMEGWERGIRQGRSDYWSDKQEQSFYDWQSGL